MSEKEKMQPFLVLFRPAEGKGGSFRTLVTVARSGEAAGKVAGKVMNEEPVAVLWLSEDVFDELSKHV